MSEGGHLDYLKVWAPQAADEVLQAQLLAIAETVMEVLLSPPVAGQAVGEWAKQSACKAQIFQAEVPIVDGFESYLVGKTDVASEARERRGQQRVTDGLAALTEAIKLGADYWQEVRQFGRAKGLLSPDEDAALAVAGMIPRRLPNDIQASKLMSARAKSEEAGFQITGAR